MNKRLIGSLLAGGISITIATLGGLKIHDTVDWNNKVNYFGGINEQFQKQAPAELKGYYLPKWEDNTIWKKQYDNLKHKGYGKNWEEKWPKQETFRDYCYENARKDVQASMQNCNSSYGWCEECVRASEWDKKE